MIDFLKELEESFRGNGVDISGMPGEVTIEDGKLFISKHMALDFSEHDKKVAEEKDKRIAELEKIIDEKSGGWGKFGLTLSEIIELQDRHQSDCIRINQLLTTIDVLTERYQKLREVHGV